MTKEYFFIAGAYLMRYEHYRKYAWKSFKETGLYVGIGALASTLMFMFIQSETIALVSTIITLYLLLVRTR